jgi:hypothetical protein
MLQNVLAFCGMRNDITLVDSIKYCVLLKYVYGTP